MPISYKHKIYIPTPDIQNANMRANYPVKSQISVNYNGTTVAFDVLDYDKHDLVDTDTVKTMCVCSHDIISYRTIPFCAPQLMYYTEGGLPAGNYRFTLDHATYGGGTQYDGTYMFTLTQDIPADGGFRHTNIGGSKASYAQGDVIGNYITTYGVRPQRAEVEKSVAVKVWDGTTACTDLGTFTARSRTYYTEDDTVNGGKRNFTERQVYGSNRWRDSVDRQWLNSTASAGTTGNGVSNWWTPQSVFDRAPGGANSAGFLYGLDPSFVAAMGKVKVITALCDCDKVDGATQDITYDKVWLQSMTEVFGNANNSISEGVRLAYWNGSTDADRIKYHNGTARYWWLRSPSPTIAGGVRLVGSSGVLNYTRAANEGGVVPAFCIKQYDSGIKPVVSYKRKLYMGRNIEWNQLVNYNNFQNQVITNGITFVSNGDGLIVANGTCTGDGASYNIIPWTAVNPAAKFLICGCPQGGSESTYKIWDTNYQSYKDFGEGCVTGDMEAYSIWINIKSGTTVRDLVFKPQFFNLTKMFGAGNEPATPEEFWSYFDHKLYPYNAGETQPLFKISRKSYIYKEPAGYTVYFADWVWIADTVTIFVEYADGSTATLTSQSDVGGKSYSNIVKMTFTDTDSERYVRYKMPANGGSEESLYMMPTVTLVLTADAEIEEIGK